MDKRKILSAKCLFNAPFLKIVINVEINRVIPLSRYHGEQDGIT